MSREICDLSAKRGKAGLVLIGIGASVLALLGIVFLLGFVALVPFFVLVSILLLVNIPLMFAIVITSSGLLASGITMKIFERQDCAGISIGNAK
jgi:hypothetical protein